MNIKKVEKKLRKINNLFESIAEDKQVSSIERDLLLSYTRSLYEQILEVESSQETSSQVPPVKKVVPPSPSIADIAKQEISTPVAPPVQKVQSEPASSPEPQPSMAAPTPAPRPEPTPQPVETKVVEQVAQASESVLASQDISDEFKELFAEVQTQDLSEKLSHSPIADLSKAMGINERIFTIQELFGGDNELFNNTISRLNSFDSYDKAKAYLANGIAKDKGWNADEKLKKAANFIKLVQRRYA